MLSVCKLEWADARCKDGSAMVCPMRYTVVQVWSIEEFRKAQGQNLRSCSLGSGHDDLAHTLAGGRVAFPPFAEILPALGGHDSECLRLCGLGGSEA